jgi:hypothetical protein
VEGKGSIDGPASPFPSLLSLFYGLHVLNLLVVSILRSCSVASSKPSSVAWSLSTVEGLKLLPFHGGPSPTLIFKPAASRWGAGSGLAGSGLAGSGLASSSMDSSTQVPLVYLLYLS